MNGYDIAKAVIGLLFGVSLFLFGMGVMGDGLKIKSAKTATENVGILFV